MSQDKPTPLFFGLDLEMEQPSNEILSIGVAYQSYDDPNTITRENHLITPSQPISKRIQDLTGLTDDMFDAGLSRADCFNCFIGDHNAKMELAESQGTLFFPEAVVWGAGDIPLLKKQLSGTAPNLAIGRSFIDVKTLILMDRLHRGKSISPRMGLRSGLGEYKMKFEGAPHDSSWDALNTLVLFLTYTRRQVSKNKAIEQIKMLS